MLRALIAMVHVEDVPRSIAFYGKLGLEVRSTHVLEGETEPVWAMLESGGARLMLTRADAPVDRERQAIFFYGYCDDVPAFRDRLIAEGVAVGPIEYPFYCPNGQFRVVDPDGILVMVTHT
ncbi:MAG TPA: VOC family protein [Planctomycetota bacterium]|nr:VOC family protein [Planctomycetota bacterium]